MRDFARQLYLSPAWKRTRAAYRKSVGGLCEECLRAGLYKPGEIVHHKVVLTPQNIKDPTVTLCWDNLELLCRDCHGKRHAPGSQRRWDVDDHGRVRVAADK